MKRGCVFVAIVIIIGSTSVFGFTGSGTEADPFLIYTKEDLTDNIFVEGSRYPLHIKLMSDIDFEGEECPKLFSRYSFRGVFDGNGKSILNVQIGQDGLFTFSSSESVLKNLTLIKPGHGLLGVGAGMCFFSSWFREKTTVENCHIVKGVVRLPIEPVLSSGTVAAGFTRMNEGIIRNCTFSGIVEGRISGVFAIRNYDVGIIEGCHADVSVVGGYVCGGLVSYNDGVMRGCSSEGTIENVGTDWAHAGGLAGKNSAYTENKKGLIVNCYSSCNVTTAGKVGGGLVGGSFGGLISNCWASGSVEGHSYLGGLIGSMATTTSSSSVGVIENSYSTGSVSGDNRVGGFIGESGSSVVRNCYSTGSVKGRMITGGFMGTNYVYPNNGYGQASVDKCYSTGKVTVTYDAEAGGLIGRHWGQPIRVTNSFWDVETSGFTKSSGGSGMTTNQMKTAGTFIDAGWDFVGEDGNGSADTWRLCEDGSGYVQFDFQHSIVGDFVCPDGVSIEDMSYLADNWLATDVTPYCGADCSGDGTVNNADFAVYAKNAKSGLIAMWPFDTGGEDIAGGNDAKLKNGTTISTTEGEFAVGGGGASLDGIDDYISTNGVCSIIAGKNVTFCAWIRSDLTPENKFLCAINTVSGENRLLFGQQGSNADLMMFDNGWQDSGAAVFDGEWHHVGFVLSVDEETMTIFVDGVSAFSYSTDTVISIDDVFSLGQEYDSGMQTGDFYNGFIDEVRIYNVRLSSGEIAAITNQ